MEKVLTSHAALELTCTTLMLAVATITNCLVLNLDKNQLKDNKETYARDGKNLSVYRNMTSSCCRKALAGFRNLNPPRPTHSPSFTHGPSSSPPKWLSGKTL